MAKMDLDGVRQFILGDEKIREYFLSLAGKANTGQAPGTGGGMELQREISVLKASLENAMAANNALEASLESARLENAMLEKSVKAGKDENDALRREMEDLRRAAAHAQAGMKTAAEKLAEFEPICRAMDVYKSLGGKSREAVRNIFRTASPDGFISCGVRKDNIANLWNFGKSLAADGSEECLKIDRLFGYFVSLYNLTFEKPVYELIEPQVGGRFDEDAHVCLVRGKRISNISGVLLRGYRVNGGTVNKALVK